MWPERESFDEMARRIRRKVRARQRAESKPPEQTNRPPLKRSPLPPQIQRFPTDDELDRLWGRVE